MSIDSFIYDKFIKTHVEGGGYTIYQNLFYGVLFLLGVVFAFKIIKKFNLNITPKFVFSTVPLFAFFSIIRVFEDALILPTNFLTQSPGIWIVCSLFFLIIVFFSFTFFKNSERVIFLIGSFFLISSLYFIRFNNFMAFQTISVVFFISVIVLLFLRKYVKVLENKTNFLIVSSHFLDASSTFVTLNVFSGLNYFEQHPVTRLIGESLPGGYLWFFVAKFVFVSLSLHYIERDVKNESNKNFLKTAILVIGLTPGIRGLFRLTMGV